MVEYTEHINTGEMPMTTKTTGTCPACFRSMTLDAKGRVARHGWKESSLYTNRGRTVGSYNNVRHTGSCFGTGYLPFEVSARGTVDFFYTIVVPTGAHILKEIAYYKSNPVIDKLVRSGYRERLGFAQSVDVYFTVRLVPGDSFTVTEYDRGIFGYYYDHTHTFSYAAEVAALLDNLHNELAALCAEAAAMCDKVAAWQPAVVKPKQEKTVLVHAHNKASRNGTYCGRSIRGMNGRHVSRIGTGASVTCPECRARMAA